jgi:hypothetical protein
VTAGGADRSVDTRQVAFVALAILGLAAAALLVPSGGAGGAGGTPDGGGGDDPRPGDGRWGDPQERDDSPDAPGGWLRWLVDLIDQDGTPPEPDDEPPCLVAFDPPPEPGATVTVTVVLDGDRAAGVPVRFEGETIGRTDADGTVTGEVPYVRELTVRVGIEGGPDCVAETSTGTRGSVRPPGRNRPDTTSRVGAATTARPDARTVGPIGLAAARADNTSVDVEVRGELEIQVVGDPYPGTDVSVRARIADRPVPDAAVSVDGDVVGTTDADGTATVTVPADGRQEMDVGVTRGEYDATAVVDILLLAADLEPRSSLAVVPGADATVAATLGDRPADDAVVSVAGRERGRTNETGHLDIVLPADPRATVRVETQNQTATTSVADHYAVTAAAVALLATLVVGATARQRGRRSAATAAVGIGTGLATLIAVLLVDAHYGATARNAVVVAGCLLVGLLALGRRRAVVGATAASGRRMLGRVAARVRALLATARAVPLAALVARVRERLLAAALGTATLLGRAVGRLRRSLAGLLALPRSVRGLRSAVVARLRRIAAASSTRRAAYLLALAVGLVAGYLAAGGPGVVAVATAAVILVVAARWVRRRRTTGREASPDDHAAGDVSTGTRVRVPDSADRRSFREVWRAFARLVLPGRWRTSTPGEVARAAVEEGYPPGAVQDLTGLFREVEYGGRPRSAEVRDRAARAYERIREAVGEGEDA